jgi:hypothetical protein
MAIRVVILPEALGQLHQAAADFGENRVLLGRA